MAWKGPSQEDSEGGAPGKDYCPEGQGELLGGGMSHLEGKDWAGIILRVLEMDGEAES